ncbi:hypothetical protein [Rothia sp. ZJ932]|uniref:hypothetical protein n=1 Tax=Rothia sp. ZJ932 TaxID=2810516 RepID=UPI001966D9DB|nr:hypothetical protein [Rothia sp. ZJ932]QRZ61800.1 hypothetical protein JR346_01260 [Rothia sp. ZJ932]
MEKALIRDESYWEQRADEALNGDYTIDPDGEHLYDQEAAESAKALFREIAGTDDPAELAKMARGRRRLDDTKKKPSPMLHLRLPEELNSTIRDMAHQRGESTSEVARELLFKGLAAA